MGTTAIRQTPRSELRLRRPQDRKARVRTIKALAPVCNAEMGSDLAKVKTEKQKEIDRIEAERLMNFLEFIAGKD